MNKSNKTPPRPSATTRIIDREPMFVTIAYICRLGFRLHLLYKASHLHYVGVPTYTSQSARCSWLRLPGPCFHTAPSPVRPGPSHCTLRGGRPSRVLLHELEQLLVGLPGGHPGVHPAVRGHISVPLLDELVQVIVLASEDHVAGSQGEGRAEVVRAVPQVDDAVVVHPPAQRLQLLTLQGYQKSNMPVYQYHQCYCCMYGEPVPHPQFNDALGPISMYYCCG